MKNRCFLSGIRFLILLVFASATTLSAARKPASKDIYEIRVYRFADQAKKDAFDRVLRDDLIPAFNRAGARVGAYEDFSDKEALTAYVILRFSSFEDYLNGKRHYAGDPLLNADDPEFYRKTSLEPLYLRFDTYLIEAFDVKPRLSVAPKEKTVFELRIYESASEAAGVRKASMFDDGETEIFDRLGSLIVFGGKQLAGPSMPALAYLTAYDDMPSRDAYWKAFSADAQWKGMKDQPKYLKTVSKGHRTFLSRKNFSQF